MKYIFSIITICLLMYSCSRHTVQDRYQSHNHLQPDTVEVKSFITRIENRFANYADTSVNSLSISKMPFDLKIDSNNHRPNPNSFLRTTTVEFNLQYPDAIKMILYTFDGLDSCVVYSGFVSKGRNSINYYRKNMPSGIYYLVKRFKSGDNEIVRYLVFN